MEENVVTVITQTQKLETLVNHCSNHEKYNRYCHECDNMRVKKLYYEKRREIVTCDICGRKVVKNSYNKHLETLVHIEAIFNKKQI